ncbi:3-hydroxyacyl-[acyl-carrier-protein] dehydratase FabZ [Synergistales bacterium]|nr:3-hydroxyacyl-[acyl-carrier-protein] dehydratase FabZ [Synergistales bacterium]
MIDKEGVMRVLPHRGHMLMVDCVTELEYGRRALGYKDVTDKEFWCDGHFPNEPIFPGALIIEMMAQICAFAFYKEMETGVTPYLAKVDDVKFVSKVTPKSRLFAEAVFDVELAGFFRMKCRAFTDDKTVAKGRLTCYIPPAKESNDCP